MSTNIIFPGKCPEDSLLLHGSCYTIEKNTWFDKWRDAEDYCHVTYPGGHLAYEHLADDNLITKIQQSLGDHSATTELWVGIRKYHWMWNRGRNVGFASYLSWYISGPFASLN